MVDEVQCPGQVLCRQLTGESNDRGSAAADVILHRREVGRNAVSHADHDTTT